MVEYATALFIKAVEAWSRGSYSAGFFLLQTCFHQWKSHMRQHQNWQFWLFLCICLIRCHSAKGPSLLHPNGSVNNCHGAAKLALCAGPKRVPAINPNRAYHRGLAQGSAKKHFQSVDVDLREAHRRLLATEKGLQPVTNATAANTHVDDRYVWCHLLCWV